MDDAFLLILFSLANKALLGEGLIAFVLFWIVFAVLMIGFCALVGWIDRLTNRERWVRP